jgi:hypothetical protein
MSPSDLDPLDLIDIDHLISDEEKQISPTFSTHSNERGGASPHTKESPPSIERRISYDPDVPLQAERVCDLNALRVFRAAGLLPTRLTHIGGQDGTGRRHPAVGEPQRP